MYKYCKLKRKQKQKGKRDQQNPQKILKSFKTEQNEKMWDFQKKKTQQINNRKKYIYILGLTKL